MADPEPTWDSILLGAGWKLTPRSVSSQRAHWTKQVDGKLVSAHTGPTAGLDRFWCYETNSEVPAHRLLTKEELASALVLRTEVVA